MISKRLAYFRAIPLVIGLIVGSAASGQSDDIDLSAAFGQAYERYEAAFSASDYDRAADAAQEALLLGQQIFGETNLNTANLRQNHALMLEQLGMRDAAETEYLQALEILNALQVADSLAAVPILTGLGRLSMDGQEQAEYLQRGLSIQHVAAPGEVLEYASLAVEAGNVLSGTLAGRDVAGNILRPVLEELEDQFGRNSPNLVPVLLALAKADSEIGNDALQLRSSKRAMDIIEEAFSDDALIRANIALEFGRDLLYMSRSPNSEPFLEDALSSYEAALGTADPRTAIASMLLGEVQFAKNRFSSAEAPLLSALNAFAAQPQFQTQEYRIRTMLAEILERDGRPDEATEQLIELGRLNVFPEAQEYLPIYKAAPIYPSGDAARGQEGSVIVQYTVTVTGRTKDHVIVDSSASPAMELAAIESARRYGYIPRVIDGEPVEVPGVTTKIYFLMQD